VIDAWKCQLATTLHDDVDLFAGDHEGYFERKGCAVTRPGWEAM
jgi:hypothetical protein